MPLIDEATVRRIAREEANKVVTERNHGIGVSDDTWEEQQTTRKNNALLDALRRRHEENEGRLKNMFSDLISSLGAQVVFVAIVFIATMVWTFIIHKASK